MRALPLLLLAACAPSAVLEGPEGFEVTDGIAVLCGLDPVNGQIMKLYVEGPDPVGECDRSVPRQIPMDCDERFEYQQAVAAVCATAPSVVGNNYPFLDMPVQLQEDGAWQGYGGLYISRCIDGVEQTDFLMGTTDVLGDRESREVEVTADMVYTTVDSAGYYQPTEDQALTGTFEVRVCDPLGPEDATDTDTLE